MSHGLGKQYTSMPCGRSRLQSAVNGTIISIKMSCLYLMWHLKARHVYTV